MAFPNIRNMINGYSRPETFPTQEPRSLDHVKKMQIKLKEVDPEREKTSSIAARTSTNPSPHPNSNCFGRLVAENSVQDHQEGTAKLSSDTSQTLQIEPAPPTTVVLKTRLHCEGCILRFTRIVKKTKGVEDVRVYKEEDVIEVDGTLHSESLPAYLTKKFRRQVELVCVRSPDPGIDKINIARKGSIDQSCGTNKTKDCMERKRMVVDEKGDTQISFNSMAKYQTERSDTRVVKDEGHEHLERRTQSNKKTEKLHTNTKDAGQEDVHKPPDNAYHEAIKPDLSKRGFQAHSPRQQQPQQTLTNSTMTDVTPKREAKPSYLRNPTTIHPLSDDEKIQNINAPIRYVVVLKMRLHWKDCTDKLKKILSEIQGVEKFQIDVEEELIEMEGTMDIKELPIYLTKKLIRQVKVVKISHQSDSSFDQSKSTKDYKQGNEISQLPIGCIGKTDDKTDKDSTNFNLVGQGDTQGHINKVKDTEKIMSIRLSLEHDKKKTGKLPPASQERQLLKHEDFISGDHEKSSGNFQVIQFDTHKGPAKDTSSRPSTSVKPISGSTEALAMTVAVLKVRLHCEGCIAKIKRRVRKIKGVQQVKFNIEEELMEVHGTMDMKQLPIYLTEKLNRKVEIIQLRSCMSPENSKKDNTEKKQDAQSNQHMISKTDDISERELNSQIDYISRIKDRTQDQCPKRNQLFNSPQDYIGSKVDDPVLENEGDRKGSEAGEKGEQRRAGEKKQNEEGPKGGVMLGEAANNKEYVMGWPAIYTHPHGYVLEYELFSDENPNACSVM